MSDACAFSGGKTCPQTTAALARAETAEQALRTWRQATYDLSEQLHAAEQERDEERKAANALSADLERVAQERDRERDRHGYWKALAKSWGDERDRLQEREQKLAKALDVTDGGRYINDWFSRINALKQDAEKWRKHIDHQHSVDRWSDAY